MKTAATEAHKKKVLFLCTHISARSQIAEGLLRSMHGHRYEVYSAGVVATSVDPRAVLVMKEIGIDISGQRSKAFQELGDTIFDLAVTVCDRARQACPMCSTSLELPSSLPRTREVMHRSFEDPAGAIGSEEEQLLAFRRMRDEIASWIGREQATTRSSDRLQEHFFSPTTATSPPYPPGITFSAVS